jgi:hypothetical protein
MFLQPVWRPFSSEAQFLLQHWFPSWLFPSHGLLSSYKVWNEIVMGENDSHDCSCCCGFPPVLSRLRKPDVRLFPTPSFLSARPPPSSYRVDNSSLPGPDAGAPCGTAARRLARPAPGWKGLGAGSPLIFLGFLTAWTMSRTDSVAPCF